MAMNENSRRLIKFLQENHGQNLTAKDVAEALGLATRSVDASFTSVIQRNKLGSRVPAEIELEDGTHKQIKFFVLNEDGLAFDPDAPVEPAKDAE